MTKISILFILVAILASFVIHTDIQISEMEVFKPASDSPKSQLSITNVAMFRELDLPDSIARMTPIVAPVNSDISFSAVDGSRPLFPALQGPDLKNSHKQVSESKKRLPSIYIEKYFQ